MYRRIFNYIYEIINLVSYCGDIYLTIHIIYVVFGEITHMYIYNMRQNY